MNTVIFCFMSFIFGVGLTWILLTSRFSKKERELIEFKAKYENTSSIQDVVRQDFVKIANEVIKQEQEDLRKQNREALEDKLQPLTKELNEFKAKVEKFNISGVENTTKIVEQINNLEKNNKTIETETRNLVEALTKNQNQKGAYGENILDTILQNTGMQEGIHYTKQYSTVSENLKDETLHKIRPDVIVNLPNNRHIIIDSKVTLSSYIDYVKDNSKLKDFKNEVKKRIIDLANKNYQSAGDIYQPDFILMYMPIDSSVSVLYEDSDIIDMAYKSNIIIVGTSSLLASIRLVNQLFAQQKQQNNIQQIVKAGTGLYETFVQFCEDLIDIQKRLDGLSAQFKTTVNRFQRTNKNKPSLFSQINALKEMGISSSKEIPGNLLENIEEEVYVND